MEKMDIDRDTNSGGENGGAKKNGSAAIMVILVGAPGSGKSTFCDQVMRASSRPWVRVCQDTIGNGKAGTKTQCVMSAATALKDGRSVLIDRCNLDIDQRADFMKLGDSKVEKHAVVLDLPAKICISRSVKRSGHEGNLQGGKAAAVVNRMLQKKELPKLSEGFARITFCQEEKDVQAAIDTYSGLGPSDLLPSGCFGQKSSNTKIQLGIMKFLKKVDPVGGAGPETSTVQEHIPDQENKDKISNREGENGISTSAPASKDVNNGEDINISSAGTASSSCNVPTLAFPSISTADFQFNLEKASDIIVEKVEEFMNKLGSARLVLVDLSHGSKILSMVKAKAAKKNIDPNKFFTFVGDITRLYSVGGLRCNVIANAANWRLKPGGGGTNAAIFNAAGPALESATKERIGSLAPGKAVVVPLPSSSPLFSREGVTHVIHVVGPNMNPKRPNCLNNDYVKGCKILSEAYSSLFNGFVSILRTNGEFSKENSEDPLKSRDQQGRGTQNGDQKVKREAAFESERSKKYKSIQKELGPGTKCPLDTNNYPERKDEKHTSKTWGSWSQALYDIAMHPEKHKNDVLDTSDDVVVLNDMYPKAQKHLLVLARVEGLDRLADVCKEHLPLLKTMHAVGLKWAEEFLNENESLIFRLGYHSIPSMRQLHLHVISQDFNSKHLKNKKHWNSFNSPFFRDSVDVIEEVSQNGKATLNDDEKLLAMELRCHRCRSAHPNIPRLKAHISSCQAPFPSFLLQNGRLVCTPGKMQVGT